MTKDEQILKLRAELANAHLMLAAVVEYHGGWLMLEKKDFEKIDPAKTAIVVQDGPKKGDVLVKLVRL